LTSQQEEKKLAVQRSTFKLYQDSREVEELAMAAQEFECPGGKTYVYGMYFHLQEPNYYIIFADCNANFHKDSSDVEIRKVSLERGVEIYSVDPSPLNIVFAPPEPIIYVNGFASGREALITIGLADDLTSQKTIKINTAGRIEIE